MNRESSRSHAVFTLSLSICCKQETGSLLQRKSKFCLVDLAGSERQRDTLATGDRLKEAGIINKSLSTLGTVINALSEKASSKYRHINYRDSKLTFLLRDSLGGNSKVKDIVVMALLSKVKFYLLDSIGGNRFSISRVYRRNYVDIKVFSKG